VWLTVYEKFVIKNNHTMFGIREFSEFWSIIKILYKFCFPVLTTSLMLIYIYIYIYCIFKKKILRFALVKPIVWPTRLLFGLFADMEMVEFGLGSSPTRLFNAILPAAAKLVPGGELGARQVGARARRLDMTL
jgi:hypothetical protein